MTSILMIEDDMLIMEPVVRALEARGYHVSLATDGVQGVALALQQKPDLVLLDVMLPGLDGWEVCKAIRRHSVVPILMVTALSEETDRIVGLELGADDYLTKPFNTRELIARIKAVLRRIEFDTQGTHTPKLLHFGNLTIDIEQRHVLKAGKPLLLRYKEFELLSLLVLHAGEIVTRAQIFDKVWGTDWLGDMRTLDVHIRWLREKLEDDPAKPYWIQTVRSVGYRFSLGAPL